MAVIAIVAIMAIILYRTNFFGFQRRGLGDSRITDRDIVDTINGSEYAIQKMPDVLATNPTTWQQYQDALADNNVYGVGLMGVGIVGRGHTLSEGQQLIIEYFESWDRLMSEHPDIFNLFPKPHELHLDPEGFFQRQGEAEVERMKTVIDELEAEARRRRISGSWNK